MGSVRKRNDRAAPRTVVAAVTPGSPAAAAGIAPGDRLVAIDARPVRDYIDYRFLTAEEHVEVEVVRPDGASRAVIIEKHPDQDLGLEFASDLFDRMRICRNKCLFCFYDQLPKGLRRSLYVKDDDFRLSFLHGNFVTLTNLSRADYTRICEQRLSPLYISVHATDVEVRRRILGNRRAANILTQMRRFARCGIEMHAQIVLCPGLNDGRILEQTVRDLAGLHPAVFSIAIVPVGLTAHRAGLPELRPVDADAARTVIARVRDWQTEFLAQIGSRLVYAADEMYLLASAKSPPADEYEGFPQCDNGVGMARVFLDELDATDFRRAAGLAVTLVTGVLARALVGKLAARMREHGVRAEVIVVENRLLGPSVTVAGLMAGEDVAAALERRTLGDVIVLPSTALRDCEFLDSVKIEELSRRLGKRIICAAGPRELAQRLARLRRRMT
jgi:putative radical SAM enzyme (TIGR03279 family)